MATVLAIAQKAARRLRLAQPSGLFSSSSDQTPAALLEELERTCRQLANEHDWQELKREHTFSTVAQAEQTNAWPSDDDVRRFVPGSMWNRTTTWPVHGPLTAREWQAYQAQTTTRVDDAFYIRGDKFYMHPIPAAGETIAYEYVSSALGLATDGTTYRLDGFSVDTDTPLIEDVELMVLGVVWRMKASEGLDYGEEHREYHTRLSKLQANDGGQRVTDIAGPPDDWPYPPLTPETIVFS